MNEHTATTYPFFLFYFNSIHKLSCLIAYNYSNEKQKFFAVYQKQQAFFFFKYNLILIRFKYDYIILLYIVYRFRFYIMSFNIRLWLTRNSVLKIRSRKNLCFGSNTTKGLRQEYWLLELDSFSFIKYDSLFYFALEYFYCTTNFFIPFLEMKGFEKKKNLTKKVMLMHFFFW